ncbi:MAG: hypothetical protein Q8R12_05135 [bacterium]|nr:hypothetical protein [bacterium]
MQSLLSLLKNPQWDAALLLFLIAGGFFWGISGGKKKMAFIILAVYVLLAVFPFLPVDKLAAGRAETEIFMWRAGIFLALLILLALFLLRALHGAAYVSGIWWEILLLAVLAAGFLAVSLLNLAPEILIKNNLLNLSPLTLSLFTGSAAKWWTILPIFGIIFL